MTKQTIVPLLAVVLLAVGPVSAQISSAVKANIPFAFTAGNISMPAGQYEVANSGPSGVLLIRGKASPGMLLVSNPAQAGGRAQGSKLVFHRYGDRYFLYQVWVQGEDRGSEVRMSKFEKELRASSASPSSVAILASQLAH